MAANDVPDLLVELAKRPEKLSALRLWRTLSLEERIAAAKALLEQEPDERDSVVKRVSAIRHIRRPTVAAWSDHKLAESFASVGPRKPSLAMSLLQAFHFAERRPVMGTFLDALDVPNVDGHISEAAVEELDLGIEGLPEALERTIEGYGERPVLLYLLTWLQQGTPISESLRSVLGARDWADAATLDGTSASEDEREDVDTGIDSGWEFTTLDHQIILALVDCVQGVQGAFDHDQADDLVEEVVQLSGRRHQSFFHLGFRDVLFERELGENIPGENLERARWYWTGVLQGLGRTRDWDSVSSVLLEHRVAAGLGDGHGGPSQLASLVIAEALCELDRLAEVPRFIFVLAVRQSPQLLDLLLGHGTTLLRADRAGEAKAVLALLLDAVIGLQNQGYSRQTGVFLEVRRRYAHCLRQLRELTRARETLNDLLGDEPDDEIRCMVLTDIGLIEAGLRRLADVIVPDAADEAAILADQLARGQQFFCDAVALRSRFAGHGHLCLGVDAMLGEEWDEAVTHLEYARATMLEDPDRYSDGKLVARVSLYFGIAICNALRAERLAHAAELIRSAMLAGARIPRYLVEPTLAALSLRSEDAARLVAETLVEVEGYSVLDHIGQAIAAHSSSIADAFLQRASEENRGAVHRADDLRSAVPILLRVERRADAEDALDQLEAFALAGDGIEEFQSFLDDADNFAPVWEQEDALVARARCEESVGAYEEASQLLAQAFHRLVALDRDDAAEGLVDRIESYGLPKAFLEPLRRRLASSLTAEDDAPLLIEPEHPLNVLVVGGDEGHRKHDGAIQRELASRYPGVEATFLHSGWSGNWQPYLEEFERRLPKHDAVVVMRFIRTGLGKKVRRACGDIPWRFCWSAGRGAIVRSVVAAATAAGGR